ncbi:MAG TPA: SurA N-terminal domain-containing protein [Oligoflexia bacterium]|nr:SurA N-terminal domain-containing protein [Oligoflexia bacterium]HMP48640.1 SurA N-terminal domain-containing protein [Oligoflexia bacterium]
MISFFRNNRRGLVGFILVGLCVLLMLPFGSEFFGKGSGLSYVAKVGDREISAKSYYAELSRVDNMLRQQFGEQYEMLASMINIKQRVLDDLVDRELLDILSDQLGFEVGLRHIEQYASTLPMFAGGVDRKSFEAFLRMQGLTENEFESKVRDQIREEQVSSLFDIATNLPEEESRIRFMLSKPEVSLLYAKISPDPKSLPVPNEDEIKRYYDSNSGQFFSPLESYPLIVRFPVSAFYSRVIVHEEEIMDAYKNRSREFTVPAEARLQKIWFPKAGTGVSSIFDGERKDKDDALDTEKVRTLVEYVRSQIETNPETIRNIAVESGGFFSEDESMQVIDNMPRDIRLALDGLSIGMVSPVIESDDQFQVLRVLEKRDSFVKPIEEVRTLLEDSIRREVGPEFAQIAAEDFMARVLGKEKDKQEGAIRTESDNMKSDGVAVEFIDSEVPISLQGGSTYVPSAIIPDILEMPEGALRVFRDGGTPVLVFIKKVVPASPKPVDEVRDVIVEVLKSKELEKKAGDLAKSVIDKISPMYQDGHISVTEDNISSLESEFGISFTQLKSLEKDSIALPFATDPTEKQRLMAELFTKGLLSRPYKGSDGAIYVAALSKFVFMDIVESDNLNVKNKEDESAGKSKNALSSFMASERSRIKNNIRQVLLTRLKLENNVQINTDYLN